jgi:hypothetical protein
VRADEPHAVAIVGDRGARQPLLRGGNGRVDERLDGTLAAVGDAVQLEAPAIEGEEIEATNRPGCLRLGEAHGRIHTGVLSAACGGARLLCAAWHGAMPLKHC